MSVAFDDQVARARSTSIEGEIVRRGIKLRRSGSERIGACPKCGGDDRFSINVNDGVWNCRGCKPTDISGDVIGMVEWLDGLDFKGAVEKLTGEAAPKPNGKNGHEPHPDKRSPLGRIVQSYSYADEAGELLFQVTRHEPKDFRQRRPDGNGGWISDTRGVRMVPYRLAELIEAIASEQLIFVVEGEKDVDSLIKLGARATCNPRGAGKWGSCQLDQHFAGAHVVVVADNDPQTRNKKTGELLFHPDGRARFAGWDHANEVCQHLEPTAASVRIIDLKTVWPACPDKGDISDWIAAGGTIEALNEIADRAVDWTPACLRRDEVKAPPLRATPYVTPIATEIPKRQWLHGLHYMRGIVTSTVAPGGFGKTTLSLFEAITMAVKGYRVWYISAEDDRDEIDRRIAAHLKHHGVKPLEYANRLFIDDKASFPFKIAKMSRAGVLFDDAGLAAFEAAIEHDRIDVVILDPFISFHYLPENDTAAMDALVKRLGDIALRHLCCIELSHHVRKPTIGQVEITVYDARGAGAIVNAVRSCRVLNQMSQLAAEVAKINPDERTAYIRIDSGKRNMAPPEHARWCRLVNIEIDNGDRVQALEEWSYPAHATSDDDKTWLRVVLGNKPYRVSSQAEDWLGKPVATRFNRSVEVKGDIKWINKLLSRWQTEGMIKQEQRPDENRTPRPYWVLGDSAKPDEPSTSSQLDQQADAALFQFDDNHA